MAYLSRTSLCRGGVSRNMTITVGDIVPLIQSYLNGSHEANRSLIRKRMSKPLIFQEFYSNLEIIFDNLKSLSLSDAIEDETLLFLYKFLSSFNQLSDDDKNDIFFALSNQIDEIYKKGNNQTCSLISKLIIGMFRILLLWV